MAFFHNGKIGRKGSVKHIVYPYFLQGIHDLSSGCLFTGKSQGFSPCGADSRGHLGDHDFFRVRNRIPYFFRIVSFLKCSYRAVGDTLSTQGTGYFGDLTVPCYIYSGPGTGAGHVPDMQILDLITYLDAAHTFDAFFGIPDERKALIPREIFQTLFKWEVKDVEVIGKLLEGTVPAPHTGCTFTVVLGEDELDISPSGSTYFWTVGENSHPLFYYIVAGSDQLIHAFQFYETDTAGCNLVNPFQVTEPWNPDICTGSGFHDCCTLRYGNHLIVNCDIYHNLSRPPLKIP